MVTALLIALGLFALVSLLIAAFLLWIICQLCGVGRRVSGVGPDEAAVGYRRISYGRALWMTVLCYVISLLILFASYQFLPYLPTQVQSPALWVTLGAEVIVLLVLTRILLDTNFLQTLLVPILWTVFRVGYAVLVVLVFEVWLMGFYTSGVSSVDSRPTGNMAVTLLGDHKNFQCPECGYSFPVNCSREATPGSKPATECTCPNCRKHLTPGAGMPDSRCLSGDRVTIARPLLRKLMFRPNRLDLVGFRFPNPDSPPSRVSNQTPKNTTPLGYLKRMVGLPHQTPVLYLKRLIGLPGETVGIQSGDLFLLPADKSPEYPQDKSVTENERWRLQYTHQNDAKARKLFKVGAFEILRKPPETMLALRRIVYDHQHQASDLKKADHQPRWKGLQEWKTAGEHAFHHPQGSDESLDWLRYQHILRGQDKPSLITDFMGYNTAGLATGSSGANWVKDLMLECEANIESDQGLLVLELSRGVDRFQARFDIAEGTCNLVRISEDGKETELNEKPTSLQGKGTYNLRFANFDQRLTVWVEDKLPFGAGVSFQAPEVRKATRENDLERPASIGVRNASVRINKLTLWRDTYYTQEAGKADVPGFDASDPSTYDEILNSEPITLYVQPGHYLVLGDNSPQSSDSRSWGLVAERHLLGPALFVYYPFTRARYLR